MNNLLNKHIFLGFALLLSPVAVAEDIVASIAPVHSLVQGVMGETGEATLLLSNAASPHGVALKPSQVAAVQSARLLFYIDEEFEFFLRRVLPHSAAEKVALARADGVMLLAKRAAVFEQEHGEHGEHGEHDEHGEHGEHDEHDEHEDGHSNSAHDFHLWLDISNAQAMVVAIAAVLSENFPENRAVYERNADTLRRRLDTLDADLRQRLAAVHSHPYILFHDAYYYMERRYGLSAVAAFAESPTRTPTVSHIRWLREKITDEGVRCVFREPQFSDKWLNTITDIGDFKIGVLDPLGATIPAGPDQYFHLMENLADALIDCLSGDKN